MLSPSAISDSSPRESSSSTEIRPDDCRNSSSVAPSTSGSGSVSGSMPRAISRRQDSSMTLRGRAGARSPAMVAS
jgi:hypothetical protein